MPLYEFQRKNSGKLETAAQFQFSEDDAACLFASRIVPSQDVTIEVWEGSRLVCRAESNGAISKALQPTDSDAFEASA
jgi:hypothetical protein